MTPLLTLPDDHDCERCGCPEPDGEPQKHATEHGCCLACGGCFDPACCSHDDDCLYQPVAL